MKIFITGATGLVGRRVVVDRLERGDRVVVLSRDREKAARRFAADVNPDVEVVEGNPAIPGPWQKAVDGCDAVIHLAGAGLFDHRWSAKYKKTILDSRVDSTHQVAVAIEQATNPPGVFICASAVGYYGDCGDDEIDESHPPGDDFLAEVCKQWEAQARSVENDNVRPVQLRTAAVFDQRGGALKQMTLPFRFMFGGPAGIKRYWMPWIHWRDLVGLIDMSLRNPHIRGPVNACSPNPVTNWQLARTIGRVLHRPWWFAVPQPAMRIAIGEFANFITASQRVIPRVAQRHGYEFFYPTLEPALRDLLKDRNGQPPGPGSTPAASTAQAASTNQQPQQEQPARSSETTSGPRPPRPPRLLAIDVDGTLLSADQTLAPGVIQACRAAERKGVVIVLASARPPRGLRPIYQMLNLTGPTIQYHGAIIWNPVERRALYHENLDRDTAAEVIAAARQAEPTVQIGVEVLDHWYTDHMDPDFLLNDTTAVTEPDAVGPLNEFLSDGVTRLSLFGPREQIEHVLQVITESFWKTRRIAVFRASPQLLHITHPMVDKGIALQRIARRLGVQQDEVMAIGDGINDTGMISWAGFGVAVDNACDQVKSIADVIVPAGDNLGVARAIQRYVLSTEADRHPVEQQETL